MLNPCFSFSDTLQAQPQDPDNFPFIVLGNKVDLEGQRVVSDAARFKERGRNLVCALAVPTCAAGPDARMTCPVAQRTLMWALQATRHTKTVLQTWQRVITCLQYSASIVFDTVLQIGEL